jgi:hypothetical protein
MSSRVTSLILFALGATIASSAQQCCTCVRDGGQGFQVPGACLTCRCDIACKANGGTYVSTQACVGAGNLTRHRVPFLFRIPAVLDFLIHSMEIARVTTGLNATSQFTSGLLSQ